MGSPLGVGSQSSGSGKGSSGVMPSPTYNPSQVLNNINQPPERPGIGYQPSGPGQSPLDALRSASINQTAAPSSQVNTFPGYQHLAPWLTEQNGIGTQPSPQYQAQPNVGLMRAMINRNRR